MNCLPGALLIRSRRASTKNGDSLVEKTKLVSNPIAAGIRSYLTTTPKRTPRRISKDPYSVGTLGRPTCCELAISRKSVGFFAST